MNKLVAPVSKTGTPFGTSIFAKTSAWSASRRSVRELNAGLITCLNPKEPPTGTQACSPCCTPTWSRRMRHWNARARARRDPRYAPQTRDAKWARGSRSQTHRLAAKGDFTQDDVQVEKVYWKAGLKMSYVQRSIYTINLVLSKWKQKPWTHLRLLILTKKMV